MRLYHFTAEHHWTGGLRPHDGPGIRIIGLHPNAHPLIDLPPLIWLTTDKSFVQLFSPRPVPGVNCDRTEMRLEIRVPKSHRDRLLTLEQVLPFVHEAWRADFTDGQDLSAWRAYRGWIPLSWVRGFASRPNPVAA